MTQSSDLELAERAARGDAAAMAELVNRALPVVRGLAHRIAGNPEDGDALAQEAFAAAIGNLRRYRGDATFATWVCSIAVRRYADIRRLKATEERALGRVGAATQRDPADLVAEKDSAQRLWHLVCELSPPHRDALIARATSQSTAQAAARLGITTNAMRVRLHRARLALREMLLAEYPEWFGEVRDVERRLPSV